MVQLKVSTHINRRDLLVINLCLLPRQRANWVFVAILGVAIFAYLLLRENSISWWTVLLAAFASAIGSVAGLLCGFVVSATTMLLTVDKRGGVLGVHDYTLSATGLHESTVANDSLHKWSGIQSVAQLHGYVLIRINGYLFHVLPRRSFSSDAEFAAVYEQAVAWRRLAHQTA